MSQAKVATETVDARLAAVRRVDWRFLLPRPELGRVGCVGPMPPSLQAGLAAAGAETTVLGHDAINFPGGPHLPPCDHVLTWATNRLPACARGCGAWEAQGAAAALKSGGWLVIEVHGLWAGRGLRRPLAPRAWVRALEREGWQDVQAYWHWPDIETSSQIIPLDEPAALRFALRRAGTSLAARCLAGLGRVALALGLLPRLAPSFCVVARRPEAGDR